MPPIFLHNLKVPRMPIQVWKFGRLGICVQDRDFAQERCLDNYP